MRHCEDWPLVTICIPAFNAEATLARTLESILAQDYPNFEVIVSDNHSTDETAQIIRSYLDKGVQYTLNPIRLPGNTPSYLGAYDNCNHLLSQARGEYICLFHSDDLYEPDIVRKQTEVMQVYPKVGAVFTMSRTIGDTGQPIRVGCRRLPKEFQGQQCFSFEVLFNAILTYGNFLPTPSLMIRRAVFEAVGGFNERQYLTSSDLEMWLRIAQKYDIGVIDEPLLQYRVSERQGGTQYNKLRTTLADFFGVVDHYLARPEVRRIVQQETLALYETERSADHVLCAINLLRLGRVAEAQANLQEALRWRHLAVLARHRPRWLVRQLVGVVLLVSIRIGLGKVTGRGLGQAYQWVGQWRQRPLGRS